MASIFGSKLFITSSRQDKIRASIANPVNKELVQQLASYIDFDEVEPEKSDLTSIKVRKLASNPIVEDSEPAVDAPSNDDPIDDETSEDVTASTDIIADKDASPDPELPIVVSELAQLVKGQLNIDSHSKGVTRAALKNTNELWVYFNDETNLNEILTAVLENLNAAGFGCLQFNRFARSDNAIVFTVDPNDTDNRVKFKMEVNNEEFPGVEEMQKRKTEVNIK